ncbi:RimK-like ATPgrasp N-terminal domain-containing protein [Methanothrix sp.]|uniref:RimK-like ATPgrasp N-terminal domain-containing protein n=1 Tax=Methanothrix sp. TaxID=90426 RepID=UPI0025EA09E9|nr:RimK-like ATPgrasp N-terminal domain-containing protein [Methanothrix sp.]MCQ8902479.1 RimK-like ATPgrasp N-terminal domain-containing protein [Methanothrix sp.]HOK58301.1 RimK-like ATPgrasp N-terminal domain-containing protein [Methanothrix sp.]HOL44162.1 RimK-like ATPgrasp N-terminal domain-containing protein [Methanothrix sp.]HPO88496.1 RimK-like ATPgrasp N-terminal domain-containing protein [Methanothrix sp.]
MYTLNKNGTVYIINENYFYKTEPYYTIVQNEFEGIRTVPSSSAVLDAYIVPICLEKARMAGIPVCEWVVSYAYITLPAIVYGLNYFSTPSEHFVVKDFTSAKKAIKHVTNYGKYPFCYQKISDEAEVAVYNSIFGRTVDCSEEVETLAEKIYAVFNIPLVSLVLVRDLGGYRLSSLAPVMYSQLSEKERELMKSILEKRVSS